jgi:hypothetical protein
LKRWEHSGMMLPSNIDTAWAFPILSFEFVQCLN